MNRRRLSDRRAGAAPRRGARRRVDSTPGAACEEQRAQFLTRYLFWALGLAYFNAGVVAAGRSLVVVNSALLLYVVLVTACLWHARRVPRSPRRWRLAMWADLIAVTVAVFADPAVVSPAYLVYLMVILGNGVRYGLRFFAEALGGGLALGGLVLLTRFPEFQAVFGFRTAFFAIFGGLLVFYAYALTRGMERVRLSLEAERSTDMLTGLLNRRALNERAEELFTRLARSGGSLVVAFADLDRFKSVNDTHGHQAGDRVLADIARLFHASVRTSDVVGRFGGDEFILILLDTNLDGGTTVARRLQQALGGWSRRQQMDLSLSVGLGQAPDHGRDLRSVLERVDQAMYRSKLAFGRGGILRVGQVLPA